MASKQKVNPYRNIDLGVTGQVVRALPVKIATLFLNNQHATAMRFVKFYDKASAATEADTPVHTIPVAPSVLGGAIAVNLSDGEFTFDTGLSIRCSTAVADADTGAPSANDMVVNLGWVDNLSYKA